mgnify:CR=1 FL=1
MRKSWGIVLAAFMLLSFAVPVHAEDYTGGSGWKVQFTGEEMVSNFTSADIADAVHALQPGDRVTISLGLENGSTGGTDWYMTNKVLSSLEDSSESARGGAYTYELSYTDEGGAVTVLFSSQRVGGEGTEAGMGLHGATDSLEEYFRLDSLNAGEQGTVTLTVALDGETQGNGYQNTLADLQMNFAVDPLTLTGDNGGNGSGDGTDSGGGERGTYSYSTGMVKTGDFANLALWSAAAFISGILLLILAVFWMRKDRKESKS